MGPRLVLLCVLPAASCSTPSAFVQPPSPTSLQTQPAQRAGLASVRVDDDGTLVVFGGPGYVWWPVDLEDGAVFASANTNAGGNSGVFVGAAHGLVFPDGPEAQIDPDSAENPTGSLYGMQASAVPPPPANTWFTLCVELTPVSTAERAVRVFVDGTPSAAAKVPARAGFIALQAHHPGAVTRFRRVDVVPGGRCGP